MLFKTNCDFMQRMKTQSLSKFSDLNKSAMLFLSPLDHSFLSQSGASNSFLLEWGLAIRSMRALAARRRLCCRGCNARKKNIYIRIENRDIAHACSYISIEYLNRHTFTVKCVPSLSLCKASKPALVLHNANWRGLLWCSNALLQNLTRFLST